MSDTTIPVDLTWGSQNFDRSADTISAYVIVPGGKKKSANTCLDKVVPAMNYPASKVGSQLNGSFRHGKFRCEEGTYIVIMNRGTYMSQPCRSGCIIIRARSKGKLLGVDAKVDSTTRSVHSGNVPVLSVRGDVIDRERAEELDILAGISRKSSINVFEENSVGDCFHVTATLMSDSREPPELKKVKTRHGEKVIEVSRRPPRNIRVRKKK